MWWASASLEAAQNSVLLVYNLIISQWYVRDCVTERDKYHPYVKICLSNVKKETSKQTRMFTKSSTLGKIWANYPLKNSQLDCHGQLKSTFKTTVEKENYFVRVVTLSSFQDLLLSIWLLLFNHWSTSKLNEVENIIEFLLLTCSCAVKRELFQADKA